MNALIGAFLVGLLASPLSAQSRPPDSLLPQLAGRWALRGTIARQQTVHDVTFGWMLNRGYLQMHEVSRQRSATGTPAYEAVVLFARDPRQGSTPVCGWTTPE